MRVVASVLLGLALATGSAIAAPSNQDGTNCKVVQFTVNGTAQNRNITGIPTDNLAALLAFYATAPVITVSGPQTLVGTYCTPTVINKNNAKLEVFFGSITADRNGWQAQGGVGTDFPPYNPNKLGTGKSSHPDPVLVVQAAYEIALYNDLANQLRKGTSQFKKYDFLIYVGNSYGSQLGTGVAGTFPNAYNEFLLTGYSKNAQQDFVGVSLVQPAPAAVVDPGRFGNLPPAYLTTSSETGRTNSFFGSKAQVSFEDIVAHLFFVRKDVVSLGQFVSVYAYPFNGAGFKGRVFVLTGEQDQAFCGPGSPVIGPAMCGPLLQQTGVLFPNAKYNWKSVDKTGHAIRLHNSAQLVYSIAHRFLGGESFQGGPPAT